MSENQPARSRRSRRAERSQQLYSSRDSYDAEPQQPAAQAAEDESRYTPNEEPQEVWAGYTPNEEPQETWAGYTPNEEPEPVDFSAYYSRESAEAEEAAEPAFAPPPKMDQFLMEDDLWADEEAEEDGTPNNVYHTRDANWLEDSQRYDAIAQSELGYQVHEDTAPPRKKKHLLRNLLIVLAVLALLAGGAWLMRGRLADLLGVAAFNAEPMAEPFAAVVTPEPVKAYDAAPQTEIADSTRAAIGHLSGTLEMETYIVTDSHIVTRHQRANGTYDFYLFTAAEGRLLCYFEGLGALDMIPQQGGSFYVAQAPWLVGANGSALIRTADLEAQLGESVFLHPLYNGWAVVESEEDGSANYISQSGQVLSTLWFSRTFPFTGQNTLAYVDTGATADPDQRYLLYVLGQDGTMSRWLTSGDMNDVVCSAIGMAYMNDGSLYHLPDTSSPVLQSPEVRAYLDCDALVIRDSESGKYGLFVHGEQHYDFAYDSIQPVESDIAWAQKTLTGDGGSMTVCAVSGHCYPQPLSHSFVLEKDGQREYVALSTQSSYPIRLDGEF